jgi:hypothetical protein
MRTAWVSRVGMVALVGGLCLVGYGLAQAENPDKKPRFNVLKKDPDWVLDTTTSLQWQKAPSTVFTDQVSASTHCTGLGDGARLPEIKELISLVDYTASHSAAVLPAGHPFIGIQTNKYVSATPLADSQPGFWWFVDFLTGSVSYGDSGIPWCVR